MIQPCASPLSSLLRCPTDSGHLDGEYPYVSVGDGPRTLVVLPGFGDAMFSGRYPAGVGLALGAYFQRYLGEHTVYLLSRPRGLPDGYTIDQGADDHARILRSFDRVDVLGISMGGLLAQQLCIRHPEIVDRLVVAASGHSLGDNGRAAGLRMLEDARRHDWASIRAELAQGMYTDIRSIMYPPFIHTVGRFLLPRPAVPDDVRISIESILAYEGHDELEAIAHPTLVIGGDRDPYFPAEIQRETADGIPDGRLSLIAGAKHGVFHERKATFDRLTTEFLAW